MTSLRKDDQSPGSFPFRSERIFDDSGLWYFKTREGQSVGPFRYETEARQMLDNFIGSIQDKEQKLIKDAIKPQFRITPLDIAPEASQFAHG